MREQVFWGWGEPGSGPTLPDHAAGFLRSALGVSGAVVSTPVSLDEVRLRPPALSDSLRARLAELGEVRSDAAARVGRCRGKSYVDLLRQGAQLLDRRRPVNVGRNHHDLLIHHILSAPA